MDEHEPTTRTTPQPEPPNARVGSVLWLDEPVPTTAPRPEGRDRRWPWLLALVVVGALAFLAGLAIATDGFTPLDLHPAPALTPVP